MGFIIDGGTVVTMGPRGIIRDGVIVIEDDLSLIHISEPTRPY